MSLSARAPATASAAIAAWPAGLTVHGQDDPDRERLERFVADVYRARYGAEVGAFAPMLVSRHNAAGEVLAVAGYRPALQGPLFLERYLERPVHSALDVPRDRIVEVGHLAAAQAGEGRKLVFQLGPHLAAQGFEWVVGTLTTELRHLFLRLGIAPQVLGRADPTVLGDEASRWGRYYEHAPVVLAGALAPALQALTRRGTAA